MLNNIYRRFVIGNIKEMDDEPDVDQWLRFLDSLPPAKDYVDESFNKYRCRSFHFPSYKRMILNAFFAPLAMMSYLYMLKPRPRLPQHPDSKLLIERKADVDYLDILPAELVKSYAVVDEVLDTRARKENVRIALTPEAVQIYIQVIRRHPFHFYYHFWIARELTKHCTYLATYNPSAIAVYVEERNIAGPILKQLYETTGRKYVSFMHGEYLLRLIQGYMAFSEYYIWDAEYQRMFSETLHCHIKRYILYKPDKLRKKYNFDGIIPTYTCTYYFSAESKESIRKLSEIFAILEESGKKCKVRPHPRYSQWEVIREFFSEDQIEDPKRVSIEKSLSDTRYVVGLATTVLAEGFYEGKEIVVDDMTSPAKYANLEKRNFVVLKRPHILLSELLQKEGGIL